MLNEDGRREGFNDANRDGRQGASLTKWWHRDTFALNGLEPGGKQHQVTAPSCKFDGRLQLKTSSFDTARRHLFLPGQDEPRDERDDRGGVQPHANAVG